MSPASTAALPNWQSAALALALAAFLVLVGLALCRVRWICSDRRERRMLMTGLLVGSGFFVLLAVGQIIGERPVYIALGSVIVLGVVLLAIIAPGELRRHPPRRLGTIPPPPPLGAEDRGSSP